MKKKLPARPLWTSVLLLLLALLARPALASHLLGGEMTYRYIDDAGPAAAPLRYEVSLIIYHNCNNGATIHTANIAIYNQGTGTKVPLTAINYSDIVGGNARFPEASFSICQTPYIPPGCTNGASQTYQLQRLTGIINLPATTQGYYAMWTEGNRNNDITNLSSPNLSYMTLYATLSPPAIFNRSPIFSNIAIAYLCANDTTYYLNNAVDADGDRLEYTFGQPYSVPTLPTSFLPSPAVAAYATTSAYSPTTPFGTGRGIVNHLNNATSVATFATPNTGKYVVAIDVKEYRFINGVEQLIGITRRDVQLVVGVCPTVAPAPKLPPPVVIGGSPVVLPRSYTIEAGTTQTIPITATQSTQNPLTLTVTSQLLDGPGGFNATLNGSAGTVNGLTGSATATGTGSVLGTFVYAASCTEARATPYDIAVRVEDKGCSGKTIFDVFRITVVKPQGPTAITGSGAVCGAGISTYTATGGTTPGVTWSVTGGTIVGSNTANPVQVQWTTAGTGTITLQGVSQGGCLTDPVTRNVVISTAPALTVTGNRTICQGSSTTITVSGGASGAIYTVTGGPSSGTGSTFVLTPTATTTYTVTASSPTNSCGGTSQVTITVNPPATATAGPAVAICSGASAQLGTTAVTGNTYSWSPATGLSSATAANPTVTLPNYTGIPITRTYTLTTTNTATGCVGTATVVVTVNPDLTFEVSNNVITANGDNMNDRLKVRNIRSFPNNRFEVYNRWGRQIYTTTNYDNDTNYWGTDPNVLPGNYYYVFKQADNTIAKGWVEVIR